MLVLLIIFIVTAPMLNHAVKVELPKAASQVNLPQPQAIQLSLDAAGKRYWNSETIDEATLAQRLQAAAAQQPQPELHIRADGDIAYKQVAGVMAAASRAGLTKIGFVTDPPPSN